MATDTAELFALRMEDLRKRREDARARERDLTRQMKALRKQRGRLRGRDDEINVQRERTAAQRKQKERFRLIVVHLLREAGRNNTDIADVIGCSYGQVTHLIRELKHRQRILGEWVHDDDSVSA